jgi:hypothetical protein
MVEQPKIKVVNVWDRIQEVLDKIEDEIELSEQEIQDVCSYFPIIKADFLRLEQEAAVMKDMLTESGKSYNDVMQVIAEERKKRYERKQPK